MLSRTVMTGRFVKTPELKTTAKGTPVVAFALACERDFLARDAVEREVDFIDCVCFGRGAEFISRYFAKGRLAQVDGRLQTRTWTTQDGQRRKAVELVVEHIYFGDTKIREDLDDGNQESGWVDNGSQIADEGELPF